MPSAPKAAKPVTAVFAGVVLVLSAVLAPWSPAAAGTAPAWKISTAFPAEPWVYLGIACPSSATCEAAGGTPSRAPRR